MKNKKTNLRTPTGNTVRTNMTTNAIVSAASLNIDKVTFGDIRVNKMGGKNVPIKYNGQSLQIRIPRMTYPMGIKTRETDKGVEYGLSVTFKGCDPYAKEKAGPETGEAGTLYNFLKDLQELLLKTAVTNSVKWFSKTRSEALLRESMKEFVRPSVEKIDGQWVPTGKYAPSLAMKIPVYDGNVAINVANHLGKEEEVTVERLPQLFPKRVEASIVVTPSVYVTAQGFGITWKVSYARVSPPQRLTAAQVFADEVDEEVVETQQEGTGVVAAAEETEETQEEEQQEVLVPSAPAPAPAPKNRRRTQVPA